MFVYKYAYMNETMSESAKLLTLHHLSGITTQGGMSIRTWGRLGPVWDGDFFLGACVHEAITVWCTFGCAQFLHGG